MDIKEAIKQEMKKHNSNSFEDITFNAGLLCALLIVEKYGKCDYHNMYRDSVDNSVDRRLSEQLEDDLK